MLSAGTSALKVRMISHVPIQKLILVSYKGDFTRYTMTQWTFTPILSLLLERENAT